MPKLRVGILTLNQSDNYGAALQAFALAQFLESRGFETFLVAYSPGPVSLFRYLAHPWAALQKVWGMNNISSAVHAKISRKISRPTIERRKMLKEIFSSFRARHLKVTPGKYTYSELKAQFPPALAYITGSDVVWAYDVFFHEPIYLLGFLAGGVKRISYAPSFGKGKLEQYQHKIFRDELAKFDSISVREQSGVDIVAQVAARKATRVLDPTFLPSGYEAIVDASTVPAKPYIFVYLLSQPGALESETIILINALRSSLALDVVIVTPDRSCKLPVDGSEQLPSPEQFLGLLKNADAVITNSFHGVVFSLLFRRKFLCVPRDESSHGKNLRMKELLELCGLEDRFLESPLEAETAQTILAGDYCIFSERSQLENYITRSRDFLIRALSSQA